MHARTCSRLLKHSGVGWGSVPLAAQFHLSQQGTKPPNTGAGIHTNPELLESTDTKHLDHWKPAKVSLEEEICESWAEPEP